MDPNREKQSLDFSLSCKKKKPDLTSFVSSPVSLPTWINLERESESLSQNFWFSDKRAHQLSEKVPDGPMFLHCKISLSVICIPENFESYLCKVQIALMKMHQGFRSKILINQGGGGQIGRGCLILFQFPTAVKTETNNKSFFMVSPPVF